MNQIACMNPSRRFAAVDLPPIPLRDAVISPQEGKEIRQFQFVNKLFSMAELVLFASIVGIVTAAALHWMF